MTTRYTAAIFYATWCGHPGKHNAFHASQPQRLCAESTTCAPGVFHPAQGRAVLLLAHACDCAELADHAEKEADVIASQQEAQARGLADADMPDAKHGAPLPNGHAHAHDKDLRLPGGAAEALAGSAQAADVHKDVSVEDLLRNLKASREYASHTQ